MPIYAYRCQSCGHAKDVLQKVSDPQLSTCPACGADAFRKQLTAAGFQLKGSGWYVTDFRGGNGAAKADAPGDGAPGGAAPAAPAKPDGAVSGTPAKAAGGEAAGTAAGSS
jgi:putative FmdB family regulatory protein